MTFGMIMNILLIACGIYMMYWSIQMKKTQTIPEMMVGKKFPINRAKDPAGFIKASFPVTWGTGAYLFIIGMIEALEVLALYPTLRACLSFSVVIVVIAYGMRLLKLQKKYLLGLTEEQMKKKKK